MKVRKAIIPAAELGTRFLPATKVLPKEMFPIVDTPSIQSVIEEAIASGIESIMIVTNSHKHAVEDYFDESSELQTLLGWRGKHELEQLVRHISHMVEIHYIRQKQPLGLGHAVLCARQFVGDEPFAVLLQDDLIQSETPCLQQLIQVYDRYGSSVIDTDFVESDQG
jgi:UTP--glucose-1-phosphate uridylyltransferase